MIKTLSVSLLLVSLFSLTACSVDWDDKQVKKITELETQISELNKEKEQDIFKRKQDCASKVSGLNTEIGKLNAADSIMYYELEDIFYSPQNATCYFSMVSRIAPGGEGSKLFMTRFLKEYGSTVGLGTFLNKCDYLKDGDCDEFNTHVRDLKKE